jgi:hypothetical protein
VFGGRSGRLKAARGLQSAASFVCHVIAESSPAAHCATVRRSMQGRSGRTR